MQAHSRRWIFAAVLYFCLGVSLGLFMGASHDHTLFPVHAHINLLGWVSLTLIGVIYHFFPVAGASRIATVQFWVHNAALLMTMGALAAYLYGNEPIEKLVAMGSVGLVVAAYLFAYNLFTQRA